MVSSRCKGGKRNRLKEEEEEEEKKTSRAEQSRAGQGRAEHLLFLRVRHTAQCSSVHTREPSSSWQ